MRAGIKGVLQQLPVLSWLQRALEGTRLILCPPQAEAVGACKLGACVDAADGLLRFAITSRGEPIPVDVLPRLFQPYFRGSGAGPRTGLGLGLYIAAEIARAHGGAIHVASSAEAGTTFTAVIPRRLAE